MEAGTNSIEVEKHPFTFFYKKINVFREESLLVTFHNVSSKSKMAPHFIGPGPQNIH